MLRAAAIWHQVRNKEVREEREIRGLKLSEKQREIQKAIKTPGHTHITDINIRENTQDQIRFAKLPWWHWSFTLLFFITSLVPFLFAELATMPGEKQILLFGISAVFLGLAVIFLFEAQVEQVTMCHSLNMVRLEKVKMLTR